MAFLDIEKAFDAESINSNKKDVKPMKAITDITNMKL
jgi:hypothetical protein